MFNKLVLFLLALGCYQQSFAQPTHTFTDAEKEYKILQQYVADGQYAFAYTLAGQLRNMPAYQFTATKAYVKDDVEYYYVLSELKLQQERAKEDAVTVYRQNH